LKNLLKENNIKSLRKFQHYNHLKNHLHQKTPYEILTEFNNDDENISDKTRQHNKSYIKQFQIYQSNLNNKNNLNEFITKHYQGYSQINKILNILIKYFDKIGEKELKKWFYDMRDKIIKTILKNKE
jgi:hypothetical protein